MRYLQLIIPSKRKFWLGVYRLARMQGCVEQLFNHLSYYDKKDRDWATGKPVAWYRATGALFPKSPNERQNCVSVVSSGCLGYFPTRLYNWDKPAVTPKIAKVRQKGLSTALGDIGQTKMLLSHGLISSSAAEKIIEYNLAEVLNQ